MWFAVQSSVHTGSYVFSATPRNAHSGFKQNKKKKEKKNENNKNRISANGNKFSCMKSSNMLYDLSQYCRSTMYPVINPFESSSTHHLWNPTAICLKFNFTFLFFEYECEIYDLLRGKKKTYIYFTALEGKNEPPLQFILVIKKITFLGRSFIINVWHKNLYQILLG